MRLANMLALVTLGCAAAFAQAPETLTFEVATIRPSPPPQPAGAGGRGGFFMGSRGGPGTPDPGQITSSNLTLKSMIVSAYDVAAYQVTAPGWFDTDRFDVVAKVPAGTTKEQTNIMWQNLLAERFGVVLHHESKEFQVDELVVGKSGSKLKETELDPNAPTAQLPLNNGPLKMDKNGFPDLPGPGLIVMMTMNPNSNGPVGRMVAKAQPISALTKLLGNQLQRPVVDHTGLTGKYDFTLEYTPDLNGMPAPPPPPPGGGPAPAPAANASEPGSNLATAIQQLGLRLVSSKAKLDVIVVDKANKTPTEN